MSSDKVESKYNYCMVCGGISREYFRKYFDSYGLGEIKYYKCDNCGFVYAKDFREMSSKRWRDLNRIYHEVEFRNEFIFNDPKWRDRIHNQIDTIELLYHSVGVLRHGRLWLDYACGNGYLADQLTRKGMKTAKYDRYFSDLGEDYLSNSSLIPGSFDMVIATSVFEHVIDIATLDSIVELVANDGCMALHTLVKERIAPDPNWFYLLPVHCSFFTNKSMQILFEKWGFQSSIYFVHSRIWFWFKSDIPEKPLKKLKEFINSNPENCFYDFKFIDYWK